jgi:LPS export ABC transporter protein LptC
MSWQKRLRIVLVVFVAGVIAAVYLSLRGRSAVPVTPPRPRVDPAAVVESNGGSMSRYDKGREVFRLRFDRQLTYPNGRTTLVGVTATLPSKDRGDLTVTAREAQQIAAQGQETGDIQLTCGVTLAGSDGLKVTTEHASYSDKDKIVRTSDPVQFSRGRMSGSGVGATYDQNADHLIILAKAQLTIAPDVPGGAATAITAGTASVVRPEHRVQFSNGATVVRGTQTTRADLLTAFLSDDDQRLTRVELRGNSRVNDTATSPGTLRLMQTADINLQYADDGQMLKRAELRTGSVLEIAGDTPASRRLLADTIDADMADDGKSLAALVANRNVQLELPSENDAPARRIRAQSMKGTGAAGEPMKAVRFSGAVEYRESAAARGKAAAVDRTARADRLDTILKPGFGAPERADFDGHVTIRDSDTAGSAGTARYAPDRGLMTLQTPQGSAGSVPTITTAQVTVTATAIDVTMGSSTLVAQGDVRSILKPKRAAAPVAAGTPPPAQTTGGEDDRRLPVMLKNDQPVNVTAAALQYDGDASRAVYTGSARLWQADTTIQGDTITLDDRSGNLSASKQVHTRMMIEQQDEKTRQSKLVESLGSADQFLYDDAARRATYTGHAHVTGPQGDVTAQKIELYLNDDGRTLNKAEAYDDVVARLEGGQRADGSRLTYYGVDERYVMGGSPVKIVEIIEGGCRETIGRSLTFTRSTDTILIVGTEGNRSRTMPGRCAGS